MNILYLFAHPNSHSFNAKLFATAISTLQDYHQLLISNLYEENFNPIASWDDFQITPTHQSYFLAQQEAYQQHQLKNDIHRELEKLKLADHLILQFPLWWFSTPAIMKGWFDRVFVKGFAYDAGKVFENGLLKGKSSSLIVTTQSPESAYQIEGAHKTNVHTFLEHIQHMLRFTGIQTREPFVTFDVFNLSEERQQNIEKNLQAYLANI